MAHGHGRTMVAYWARGPGPWGPAGRAQSHHEEATCGSGAHAGRMRRACGAHAGPTRGLRAVPLSKANAGEVARKRGRRKTWGESEREGGGSRVHRRIACAPPDLLQWRGGRGVLVLVRGPLSG